MDAIGGLYWVPAHEKQKWRKRASFTDRFGLKTNLMIEPEGTQSIGLPRTWAPLNPDEDLRTLGEAIEVNDPPIPRNAKQATLLNTVAKYFLDVDVGWGGQIVAPTGFGKTWVGCHVIALCSQTTLVVTTKTDEMHNWKKHCKEMLGVIAQEWHGDVVPDEDAEIVIGLVQSVAKGPGRYGEEIYQRFGLVIFDECHRLGADFFVQACWHLPALWRFGMSATPERVDGREPIIQAHLGGIIAEAYGVPMVPKVYMVNSEFKLPVTVVKGKVRAVEPTAGKSSWVDKALRRNAQRNAQLVRIIDFCHEKGRRTVIFSNEKRHLRDLAAACSVPDEDIDFYIGGRSPEALDQAAAKLTIFATYQMGGQGTNYPWWDTVVMATPLANIKQAIGRVLREFPDKRQPLVFDICDPGGVWGGYRKKRESIYEEYGAEIEVISV